MMGPFGYGDGWGPLAAGWVMMLVFWALVITGVALAVRWANAGGFAGRRDAEPPMEILRRRYAARELTKEQFELMKRDVA
jgi:putative membrane protein